MGFKEEREEEQGDEGTHLQSASGDWTVIRLWALTGLGTYSNGWNSTLMSL